MTKSPVERIGGTFRLRDVSDPDTAPISFDFLCRLIAWRERTERLPGKNHDELLRREGEEPFVRISLFLHLATTDPVFFGLSKRMMAYTLRRHQGIDYAYQLIAAQLLEMAEPEQVGYKSTRDALMVMAIQAAVSMGYRPTAIGGGIEHLRSEAQKHGGVSHSQDAVLGVWKQRKTKLMDVGFSERETLDFLKKTSPMNS